MLHLIIISTFPLKNQIELVDSTGKVYYWKRLERFDFKYYVVGTKFTSKNNIITKVV